MRLLIIVGLFVLQNHLVFSQSARGTVIDKGSGKPIPYVNMGIKNQNFGTISDEDGRYQFSFSENQLDDTITIQHVSYESNFIPVKELIDKDSIYLKEKVATLDEIKITSRKLKPRKFGIRTHNPLLHSRLGIHENTISEIAQEIKINKPIRLLDLNLFVRIYSDSLPLKYRVKFYTSIDDTPGELIGNSDIVAEGLIPKWNRVDLKRYNIVMEKDFFVSVEFLPISDGEMPYLSPGCVLVGGNRYSRDTSLGTWEKDMGGYTLYITGEY